FQAEDGIRDFHVTGVQTCALPIYRLLDDVHRRGLRLIMDFVPNHTSDRHGWFEESRSSRESPKRDWYIWADPAPDGGPPTNWLRSEERRVGKDGSGRWARGPQRER